MVDISPSTDANLPADSVSTQVVVAVAAVKGVDPTDLPPLFDAVDPDALDRLFPSGHCDAERSPGTVKFTFAGCEIVVDATERVTVDPADASATDGLQA